MSKSVTSVGACGSCVRLVVRAFAGIALLLMFAGVGPQPGAGESTLAKPVTPPSEDHPLKELYSGYRYQPAYLNKIQDKDIKNPGMLWYDYGRQLWDKADGESGKSCASCHNVADKAMRGVGARYPQFYPPDGELIGLEKRINLCRSLNMKASPWPRGSDELLALTTYVRAQSRGMPVSARANGPAASLLEEGKAYFYRRRGQLNMSCAGCHQLNAGNELRATTISQGHSNGFPAYKVGAERVISLHRQFQRCNKRVRAEPLPLGADAYVNLELYLAWRGSGLPIETPAVRN